MSYTEQDFKLNNIMYIDDDIYMGNINADTYIISNQTNTIFKYINKRHIGLELVYYFDNATLVLNRNLTTFTYKFKTNFSEYVKTGYVKNEHIKNYPYNNTMTGPLLDLEYYSIKPLINPQTYLRVN
jgi:hypothetical protein